MAMLINVLLLKKCASNYKMSARASGATGTLNLILNVSPTFLRRATAIRSSHRSVL